MCAVDVFPGAQPGIMVYTLNTLSWFWVPVILFAIHVAPDRMTFTLQYAQQMVWQSGGLFDMQVLVDAVNQMMASGIFQLRSNEISNINGTQSNRAHRPTTGSCTGCPYIQSAAQDRLIALLNNHVPALMGQISYWIQHLYACEVISMQVHAQVGPVYEVDPWLPHHYMLNGHVMYMSAPGQQIHVSLRAGIGSSRYICSDIMTDIRALNMEQAAWTRFTGRQLDAYCSHSTP